MNDNPFNQMVTWNKDGVLVDADTGEPVSLVETQRSVCENTLEIAQPKTQQVPTMDEFIAQRAAFHARLGRILSKPEIKDDRRWDSSGIQPKPKQTRRRRRKNGGRS